MVVIGLGSPFLSDDGVGPRVVRELARQGLAGARLVEAHAGGLLLVEELAGAERAVIVDALIDERREPGEVVVSGIGQATQNASCSHDCDLPQAMALGRAMGLPLPEDAAILLVAVVAGEVTRFSETLSPAVEAAVPEACAAVRAWLAGVGRQPAAEAA
ncbi:MAG: hydrogenase maturation protease [Deltaproteobacteria bacterium]|nr:hydrogenase maturation protease [Deltaproteobacteria bacterium]